MYLTRRILNNATNGAVLQFRGDNSEFGGIEFNNNLALSSSSPVTMSMQQTFNIDGADAFFSNNLNTSGSLTVADTAKLSKTLIVSQGSTLQGTLDVTGESIFASNTTVSGTLKAESDLDFSSAGGNLKAGSINALTVNSAGEVTKIGQDTPEAGDFLKWDSINGKVVWDAASVTSLPLSSIAAANNSSTRIENTGDLHLDSTGGELFLSSSNDFSFISSDATSNLSFQTAGLTSGKGQINLQIIDRGNNRSLSQISLSGFNTNTRGLTIKDGNNDISNFYLSGFGIAGAEITNSNDMADTAGFLHVGTINQSSSDRWGQYTTGSLLFSATDRRFIFCDSGKSTTYSGRPKPFFHIKKNRTSLDTNIYTDFEVELNATKGQASAPINNWNDTSLYNHSTFLKFNQDGEITKLGHDTPTDGQVLTWDATNNYVVWSDTASSYSTLDSLTDTSISSTPEDREFLKYNGTNWVNASPYPPSSTIGLGGIPDPNNFTISEAAVRNHTYITYQAATQTFTLPDPQVSGKLTSSDFVYIQLKPGTTLHLKAAANGASTETHIYNYPSGYATNGNSITFDNIKYTKIIKVSLRGNSSSNLIYYVDSNLLNLGQTQDVEIGASGNALANGHVLTYNNTNQKWENKPSTPGAQNLTDLTDTDFTTTAPSDGDYLKYNGTKQQWEPAAVPVSNPTYLTTSNSPITANLNYHYSIDTTIRPVIINLPQIIMSNRGKRIIVKFKTGNKSLTVKPATGDTIEGVAEQTMSPGQTPGQSLILVSDGSGNWEII